MHNDTEALFTCETVENVTLARILTTDLRQPSQAVELGEAFSTLIAGGTTRLIIDFSRVGYMGSTGFATLLVLARKATKAGGQLKLCGFQPEVRFGADILGIGSLIEIHDDERSALASF